MRRHASEPDTAPQGDDTYLLLWIAAGSADLTNTARVFIEDPVNEVYFITVNLWIITIKLGLGREDVAKAYQLLR